MYKHILFATDLSDASSNAAKTAAEFSEKFSTELTIVHVMDAIPPYACGYLGMSEFTAEFEDEAYKHLREVAEDMKKPDAHLMLEKGSTKMSIVKLAKKIGADLIITGSHGRHGLVNLLGSTASGILHGADCDVLVVKTTVASAA